MENYPDLSVIENYRHNMMNEIQLVHSYLHMGKIEQAKQKLSTWINHLKEERKLMFIDATQLVTWIFMFNYTYDQLQLTYSVNIETSLKYLDSSIANHCKDFVHILEEHVNKDSLYYVHIDLSKNENAQLLVTFHIKDAIDEEENVIKQWIAFSEENNLHLKIAKDNTGIICKWKYLIDDLTPSMG